MRAHDISGLIVCAAFYILPFAIIFGFALSSLIKNLRWEKQKKISEQLEKRCKDCKYRYLGTDYLYHCNIANLGPDICSPKMQWCYRKEETDMLLGKDDSDE